MGNIYKFKTYVPNQDKNKKFLEKKLSDITTIKNIPSFSYESIAKRAQTVDVIWFNERNMPFRFYEVEHSTNIQNSLDKFYDLQDFRADCYIVADECRRKQFNALIERTIYKDIEKNVKFFNYENLVKQYEHESMLANMEKI